MPLLNLLLCASIITGSISGAVLDPGLSHSNLVNFQNDDLHPPASTDPKLNGMVDEPNPNDDYVTWFPKDTNADPPGPENPDPLTARDRLSPRGRTGRNFFPYASNGFEFTSGKDEYDIKFSACASVGSTPVGTWTFFNGTTGNASWWDIQLDARNQIGKEHKRLNDALDAGITRNTGLGIDEFAPALALHSIDDIGATSNFTVPPPPPSPLDAVQMDNYYRDIGHQELRKLLDFERPTARTLSFLATASLLAWGVTTFFAINGNPGPTPFATDGLTWNNFQGGVAAFCIIWLTAIAGWVFIPGVRSTINRLTASAVVAAVRQLQGPVSQGSSTDAGGAVNDDQSIASGLASSEEAARNLARNQLPNAIRLSAIQMTNAWFMDTEHPQSTAAGDAAGTSFAQTLSSMEAQDGLRECPAP